MKHKSFDRQPTMEDFEAKKAKDTIDKVVNEFTEMVNSETDVAMVQVLQHLGFKDAHEGMTVEEAEKVHAEMLKRGEFINVSKEMNEDGSVTVKISLVKCLKELNFKLGVDSE